MSISGAVVGVVESGSAAVLVTIDPDLQLLDRRRVVLIEPGLPTHPHHHEGSWAVGRYLGTPGARAVSLEDAVGLVERVQASAAGCAREALASLAAAVPVPITHLTLRAYPDLPATVEGRIRDSRAQTFADSAMYRDALAAAAIERGWSVWWYDRERITDEAARVLEGVGLDAWLRDMGRAVGTPWQAAHKLAATAALACVGHARP